MLKYVTFILLTIVSVTLLFLIIGVPSDFLVDKIRTRFAAETGYHLQISGGAKLRLWPTPSIVVNKIILLNKSDHAAQLSIASVRLKISAASLFGGQPEITEFSLIHPILRVPLLRWAAESNATANVKPVASNAPKRQVPDIGRIIVEDGSVVFVRPDNQIENRIDHVNIAATLPERRLVANISAKAGAQILRISIKSRAPVDQTGKPLPFDLTLEAPGMLDGTLTSTANVTSIGYLVKINDLEGTIGKDRFTGWASADMTTKPRVKVDLDFKRLTLAAVASQPDDNTRPSAIAQPWSDHEINLDDLNYVDAQLTLSAAEFQVGKLRLAPVYVEAFLLNGVLNLAVSNTGIYGGRGNGLLTLDVSNAVPSQTMQMNLNGVRALPLLSALADFRGIDGAMQSKIDVRAAGASQRAMMAGLAGTVDILFQDGEIRSVNIAQMVRTLTQTTLNGWQQKKAEKTDLTELSALFKIDAGRARTDNLKLNGPLIRVNGTGTADIAAKTLQFKLDTKLVMSLEGQGGAANPVGFGVPIMVDGKWDTPRIYPEIAGILDNPEAAYSKLHDLGAGLFGDGKFSTGSDSFIKGMGKLFNNKGDDGKDNQPPAAGDKKDQAQSAQPQGSQLQDSQAKGSQPQASQAQDAKPEDTQTQINNILKNLFGK